MENKFGINDFDNPETLGKILEILKDDFDFRNQPKTVKDILFSIEKTANFWIAVLDSAYRSLEDKYSSSQKEDRINHFKRLFSFELLKVVLIASKQYISSSVENFIEEAYPRLSLIRATNLTSWHAFYESTTIEQRTRLFDTLNNLPDPFGDSRFTAVPVHTNCIGRGHAHSPWLHDIEGHFQTLWNEEKKCREVTKLKSAYQYFYLDAKVGVLFLFNNRPSITLSFNVDKYNNVYVHQIQSKQKDRGHYKLGENWRLLVLDYVKQLFPRSKVYLIGGEQAAKDTYATYGSDTPLEFRPTPSELERIAETYNEFPVLHSRIRRKAGKEFRRVA